MQRRRFNRAQRVVVVFGLGAVLYLIGGWATSIDSFSGWVGYAPLRQGCAAFETTTFIGGFLHPWVRFAIWLVLIALWVGVSLSLLRSPPIEKSADESSL
ncbi:MAG: hypothetical protein HKL85_10315 [Acidimicrobiaceae bacterium]|nr:hypothetical protein [Acidimicrobiaceae bacterium]